MCFSTFFKNYKKILEPPAKKKKEKKDKKDKKDKKAKKSKKADAWAQPNQKLSSHWCLSLKNCQNTENISSENDFIFYTKQGLKNLAFAPRQQSKEDHQCSQLFSRKYNFKHFSVTKRESN